MTKHKQRTVWIPALTLPLFLLAGCGGGEAPAPETASPVAVRTVRVTAAPDGEGGVYAGTVRAIGSVRLATKVMSTIVAIEADEGETVRAGETLVRLRAGDLEAKRAQAQAAVAEAEAHFRNAVTQRERIEALYAKEAATRKELDDVRTAYAGAEARRRAAGEVTKEVDELLRYTTLTAPFGGAVTRKWMEAGDLAAPGQPIVTVERIDRVKVVAKVPEGEVDRFAPGQVVSIEVLAGSPQGTGRFEGRIDAVLPAADPMSRQFEIQVVADNPDGRIKPGMFARIGAGGPGGGGLSVPLEALFRRGQLEGLYVVGPDDRARLRWVRTGAARDGAVEVLSGIDAGEAVVVEGLDRIADGRRVEVAR